MKIIFRNIVIIVLLAGTLVGVALASKKTGTPNSKVVKWANCYDNVYSGGKILCNFGIDLGAGIPFERTIFVAKIYDTNNNLLDQSNCTNVLDEYFIIVNCHEVDTSKIGITNPIIKLTKDNNSFFETGFNLFYPLQKGIHVDQLFDRTLSKSKDVTIQSISSTSLNKQTKNTLSSSNFSNGRSLRKSIEPIVINDEFVEELKSKRFDNVMIDLDPNDYINDTNKLNNIRLAITKLTNERIAVIINPKFNLRNSPSVVQTSSLDSRQKIKTFYSTLSDLTKNIENSGIIFRISKDVFLTKNLQEWSKFQNEIFDIIRQNNPSKSIILSSQFLLSTDKDKLVLPKDSQLIFDLEFADGEIPTSDTVKSIKNILKEKTKLIVTNFPSSICPSPSQEKEQNAFVELFVELDLPYIQKQTGCGNFVNNTADRK